MTLLKKPGHIKEVYVDVKDGCVCGGGGGGGGAGVGGDLNVKLTLSRD